MRRLKVLLAGLPLDAAVWRDGEPDSGWRTQEHLTARLVEGVERLHYLTALVHTDSKKRSSLPKPTPVPRPGVAVERARERARERAKPRKATDWKSQLSKFGNVRHVH